MGDLVYYDGSLYRANRKRRSGGPRYFPDFDLVTSDWPPKAPPGLLGPMGPAGATGANMRPRVPQVQQVRWAPPGPVGPAGAGRSPVLFW